jgi:lipoyl(octanoyl) transferase
MLSRASLHPSMLPRQAMPPVEWQIFEGLMPYDAAVAAMEARADAIAAGEAAEAVFLVEHPPLYTAGTSARDSDLVEARFPVHKTGRGGQFTYHGPGQRVVYVMLDLNRRQPDLRAFVGALERWIIATLESFNIKGETREDRVGVWVARPEKPHSLSGEAAEGKIAALGIRVRRWVTFHGIALNIEPELSHFSGIVPCGIAASHLGTTSFADLGHLVSMAEVDSVLRREFEVIFGPTTTA